MSESTTQTQTQTPAPDAAAAGPTRPQRRRVDLLWRLLVVVGGAVSALAGAPDSITGSLVLIGLLLVIERLARLRGEGALDVLLVTVGGGLVALVLVGLVLGASPIGLRSSTWTIALATLSVIGLAIVAFAPPPAVSTTSLRSGAVHLLRVGPWLAAGVVVVAVAVTVSTRSVESAERLPLQMSIGQVDGTRVQVVVSSSEKVGPLEIRTTGTGSEISYPLITVVPGKATSTILAVPGTGRATITLNYPDQTQPLRTLTIDR
ncbi:MAG: hypothetical protein L0H96_14030 [Humibacillus sp.]|nr:hypothetical protein [Humibacillus sp.]MDN5778016.1 hypothetical protein [Humibacillus sp.]